MDFCLGKRKTSDIQGYQGQADFRSIYGTTSTVLVSFPPWWVLQCSATDFPYNFVLLSQAILAFSPRCYWIFEAKCLIENHKDSSSQNGQNVVSCVLSLRDGCPGSLKTILATHRCLLLEMHSVWLKQMLKFPLLWNQPHCLMGWRAT